MALVSGLSSFQVVDLGRRTDRFQQDDIFKGYLWISSLAAKCMKNT